MIVYVNKYQCINPEDIHGVAGFPEALRIVVILKNGHELERFVSEKRIDELMEPSRIGEENWSTRQKELFEILSPRGWFAGKGVRKNMCDTVDELANVSTREDAFEIEFRKFVASLNKQ